MTSNREALLADLRGLDVPEHVTDGITDLPTLQTLVEHERMHRRVEEEIAQESRDRSRPMPKSVGGPPNTQRLLVDALAGQLRNALPLPSHIMPVVNEMTDQQVYAELLRTISAEPPKGFADHQPV